jgi:hypothetical protein
MRWHTLGHTMYATKYALKKIPCSQSESEHQHKLTQIMQDSDGRKKSERKQSSNNTVRLPAFPTGCNAPASLHVSATKMPFAGPFFR